ncbi:MAG: transposase [Phycisphaerae bacterium]|nr:transposase [Phycisphaerae bacterium]
MYHVMNRANGRLGIFKKDLDFIAFENILAEGIDRYGMRICGYCIMSNHWHMLLWPSTDDTMPNFMHWVTVTHTRRWHTAHGTTGIGHVYQGRYKSFPVQKNRHYLKTLRYIEANPINASMVESAAEWPWSSIAHRKGIEKPFELDPGPVQLPENWLEIVDKPLKDQDNAQLKTCIKKGCPFGQNDWVITTAQELHLQSTLRKPGRPVILK